MTVSAIVPKMTDRAKARLDRRHAASSFGLKLITSASGVRSRSHLTCCMLLTCVWEAPLICGVVSGLGRKQYFAWSRPWAAVTAVGSGQRQTTVRGQS